ESHNVKLQFGWLQREKRTDVIDVFHSYVIDPGEGLISGEQSAIDEELWIPRNGRRFIKESVYYAMISFYL
ncbi:MAG: hypothetical protein JSV80_06105, partial [Acidobacteriota bacterium]